MIDPQVIADAGN